MTYSWYQIDFEPVVGQQYNEARFRAASLGDALFWPVTKPNFKNRKIVRVFMVDANLQEKLNKDLIRHLQTR